ncbi:hypothetical protein ES703_91508 [subsurface metagenome]
MIWRNHWFYLHHNRLNLRTSTHPSPFNALDEEVREVVYAGVISIESIVKSWREWWEENRDKPFHIAYLTRKEEK